jgi:dienelactone hydrolase
MSDAPRLWSLGMTVPAADGLVLRGTLSYPSDADGRRVPLAVLAHQYPATRDSYGPLVRDLHEMGVATLAFDERGHGKSIWTSDGPLVIDAPYGLGLDAFGTAFVSSIAKVGFHRIDDDVVRVTGWGVSQNFIDDSRLVLVGASVGAPGVALAAPRLPGLRALVTFGAAGIPAFGADAAERTRAAVASLDCACLFASSEGDPFDGASNSRTWGSAAKRGRDVIVPGDAHAMAIYFDVRDEVLRAIRDAV